MKHLCHFSLTLLFVCQLHLTYGQCPGSSSCEASETFCAISALDGFTCVTPDVVNDYFPRPSLCFGVGVPNNIAWWSFVGASGPLTLTFETDPSKCMPFESGIQAGVFEGSCDGSQVWDCNAACNQDKFSLTGMTTPGEIYYLWVDGCNAVICTYTITAAGSIGTASLQRPMPRLVVTGPLCPCSPYEVCFPGYANGLQPQLRWTVDGEVVVPTGDDCETFTVPEDYTGGETIQICLYATIGNPDDPNAICDQDFTCTTILVSNIESKVGDTLEVCLEQQPFVWHGDTISSSCISPPCTVRTQDIEGCCVDSIRAIRLLPGRGDGNIDTFICDASPFVTSNGDSLYGEVCDSLMVISDSLACDSTYSLTIRRPSYAVHLWEYVEDEMKLCLELDALPSCGVIDSTDYELIWTFEGEILDTLPKDSCIKILYTGEYGAEILYPNRGCATGILNYVMINTGIDRKVVDIVGDDFLCEGDSTFLLVKGNADHYMWSDGTMDTLILIDSPGTYCVTGWRENLDTCTTCWDVEASDIYVSDSIIEPDNGSGTGRIILRIENTHSPTRIRWSTGGQLPMIRDLQAGMYSVTLTNDKGCERAYNFEVPLETSIGKILKNDIDLYPNPASSLLTIKCECPGAEYEILNVEGRIITKGQVSSVVDVKALLPGVYIIRILHNDEWKLATFVKY